MSISRPETCLRSLSFRSHSPNFLYPGSQYSSSSSHLQLHKAAKCHYEKISIELSSTLKVIDTLKLFLLQNLFLLIQENLKEFL